MFHFAKTDAPDLGSLSASLAAVMFILIPIAGCGADDAMDPTAWTPAVSAALASDPDTALTWTQCRRAYLAGTLVGDDRADCDALHRSAAVPDTDGITHRFGLRLVYLNASAPVSGYVDHSVDVMSDLYRPAGIAFEIHEVLDITVPLTVTDTSDPGTWTLQELRGDIAAHLELPGNPSATAALDALKSRLLAAQCDPDAVADLSLSSRYRVKAFLQLMARVRPALMFLYLTPAGENMGTRSAYPADDIRTNISTLRLDATTASAPLILAHEMGHAFGLKHSHGKGDPRQIDELLFNDANLTRTWGSDGPFVHMTSRLGNKLHRDLWTHNPYLPYDASEAKAVAFETFVRAAIDTYVLPSQLYRKNNAGNRVPIDSNNGPLAALRSAMRNERALYYKIIGKKFSDQSRISNCNHPLDMTEPLSCTYGAGQSESGTDAFLDAHVTLENGTRSDLMSYIVPLDADGAPNWSYEDPEKALVPRQWAVARLAAHAEWIQQRRNFNALR